MPQVFLAHFPATSTESPDLYLSCKHLGSSHLIEEQGKGRRSNPTIREQTQFKGETSRRHLGLPLMHIKTIN